MPEATIIEILLGVLAVVVGLVSFLAAKRADVAQANQAVITIDAQAYERAQTIYESAIATLERRVTYLETEVAELRKENDEQAVELARLRRENAGLRES